MDAAEVVRTANPNWALPRSSWTDEKSFAGSSTASRIVSAQAVKEPSSALRSHGVPRGSWSTSASGGGAASVTINGLWQTGQSWRPAAFVLNVFRQFGQRASMALSSTSARRASEPPYRFHARHRVPNSRRLPERESFPATSRGEPQEAPHPS